MERLAAQFDRKKTNFYSDSSLRMKDRPYSVQSGEGRGHEDFGSSFASPQPSRPLQGETITSRVKPATLHPIIRSPERHSSDDELLLSTSPVRKRAVRGKATVSTSQETNLAPNGLPYHPDFPPDKKLPNFKKNKKGSQVEESILEEPPSSSFPNPDDSQELSRPTSDNLLSQILPSQPTAMSRREKDAGSSKRTTAHPDDPPRLPSNTKDLTRRKPVEISVSRKLASPSPLSEDGPPKPIQCRVRPRPVKAGSSIFRNQNPEATPRTSRQPKPFPLPSLSLAYSGSSCASDASPPRKSVREPSVARKENANVSTSKSKGKTSALSRQHTTPFPMSPPGKSNLSAKQPLLDAKAPKPFPLLLHTSKQALDYSNNFPVPSPLASPVQSPSLNEGKGRELEDDIVEVVTTQDHTAHINGVLRPFPMNSGEIKTAPHSSCQSPSGSVGSKRTSDDSDGERERKVKRHKEGNPG